MTRDSLKAAYARWFTNPGFRKVICQQARYLGIDMEECCDTVSQ